MPANPLLAGAVIAELSRWNIESEPQFEAAVKAGLAGVIVKYTQGLDRDDPAAIEHAWDAYGAGVELLGGYHFGDASDPAAQARHFLGAMRADYGGVLDGCLVMLDLEGNGSSTMSVAQAERFVTAVHAELGRWPVLYLGRYGPDGMGTGLPSAVLSQCDLMLPAYGEHADLAPILPPGFRIPRDDADRGGCLRLWQFTDGTRHGGPFPGLGRVDRSYAVGFSSRAALAAWWGR